MNDVKYGDMAKSNKVNISFALPVSFLKEGKYFIAYTPALDLSTSGKNLQEAKKRFGEAVQIFFEEIIEKGSLVEVLTGLGWQKIKKQWSPPMLITQETTNFKIPIVN